MHILIAHECILPVILYGGTERVLWALGRELVDRGCKVTYLLKEGSTCDFADVLFLEEGGRIAHLIPADVDVLHLNFRPADLDKVQKPYVINVQGNSNDKIALDRNTIFVSNNHAARYGSSSFIHNGMNWDDYTPPDLKNTRKYFHFLAKAAWRIKNVKGAIDVVKRAQSERLDVLGGVRFNFKMGIRMTLSPKIRFHGMVGGKKKDSLVNGSKGLLFPVRWHEPFGIAIIESLFYGCPVFGTPYGSLSELINEDVGFLGTSSQEMAYAIKDADSYSRKACHEYAREYFNASSMTEKYLLKYQEVQEGKYLNEAPPVLLEIQQSAFLPWS